MTKGSSAARQDLRKRRGLSKLEQGYMGFVLILPWLIGFCIFKLYPFVSSLVVAREWERGTMEALLSTEITARNCCCVS